MVGEGMLIAAEWYRRNSSRPSGDLSPEKFGAGFQSSSEDGGNIVTDDSAES